MLTTRETSRTLSRRAFEYSMPFAYRARHSMEEVRAHHQVVTRRGGALLHTERCPNPRGRRRRGVGGTVRSPVELRLLRSGGALPPEHSECLCVVADDRPELPMLVAWSAHEHALDVSNLTVYRRKWTGGSELLILLRVRLPRAKRARRPSLESGPFSSTLRRLVADRLEAEASLKKGQEALDGDAGPSPEVRLDDTGELLIVEGAARPGTVFEVTRALALAGVPTHAMELVVVAARMRAEVVLTQRNGNALTGSKKARLLRGVRRRLGVAPASEDSRAPASQESGPSSARHAASER